MRECMPAPLGCVIKPVSATVAHKAVCVGTWAVILARARALPVAPHTDLVPGTGWFTAAVLAHSVG